MLMAATTLTFPPLLDLTLRVRVRVRVRVRSASFGSHLEGTIGESEEEGYLAPVMAVRGQTLNLTLTLILILRIGS